MFNAFNQMNQFNTNKDFVFNPNNVNKNQFINKNQFGTHNFISSNFTSNIKIETNIKQNKTENRKNSEDIENYIKLNPNYAYTGFQKQSLARHNKYRREHHVDDLKLSNELCEIAQKYADYLAANNKFEHSYSKFKSQSMGENLYTCTGFKPDGNTAVDSWYEEISDYNFKTGESINGNKVGHLTQVLWKDSKYVGVLFFS